MSEYPPGTRPDRWRFPARNRIIAGISSAVVVVEAGVKGGALITGLAAEMGRPVLVVPGDVDRFASVGCNLSYEMEPIRSLESTTSWPSSS